MSAERVLLVEKSLANSSTPCSVSRVVHLGQNVAREVAGSALLVGVLALAACTSITGSSIASNTVSTFSPITSVEVDSSTLFERLGCGQAPNVPFKYVVTVASLTNADAPFGIVVTNCFSNAVFENLPPELGPDFTLRVDVFDEPHFDAPHPYNINDPSVSDEPQIRADAQWKTTCTAHQTTNVQSLAVCDPLQ
jgi:hypothetical protein